MVIIMSCTGAAVTALLLMLKPVSVKYFSAEWQWRIWLVAVVCMLVPLWQLLPSKEVERREPQRVAAVLTEEKSSAAADKMPDRNGQDERIDTPAPNTAPPRKASRRFHITVTRALVYRLAAYVWLLGALMFFAIAFGNYVVFLRRKKRHSTAADTELFETVKAELGIKRKIRLRTAADGDSPMLAGIVFPTVYIPADVTDRTDAEMIFRHELTHFRHGDLLYKQLTLLVNAIHWFNPFAYLLSANISRSCELYCDMEVTRGMSRAEKERYMETILTLAENAAQTKGRQCGNIIKKEENL